MATRYQPGQPVRVTIGSPSVVELPPRVFRGRLLGMLFDYDKTFLLPSALRGIRDLKRYYDEHPGMHLLVVGHTDSTGEAGYNVRLSEERAKAMVAYLRDEVDAWLGYFKPGKPAGKLWGTIEEQHMLTALADYKGNIDGKLGPQSQEAVRRFQESAGLPTTGKLDANTRRELVTRYLEQDETTLPKDTVLTTHGCGPHHPEESGDNEESRRRNRRVEIFLSDGPIEPPPGAPDGPEYREWVKKTTETVDFTDAPEELVELELEWPAEIAERLPPDVVLRLSGPEVKTQDKALSTAEVDAEVLRFAFRWIERAKKVDLHAVSGSKIVELWREQVPGDLEQTLEWLAHLEDLAVPTEVDVDDSSDAPVVIGSLPEDEHAGERLV